MKLKVLKIFAHIWAVLATILILGCLLLVAISAPSLFEAWQRISSILSPFNIVNWIVTCFTFSPAFIAWLWVKDLEKGKSLSLIKQLGITIAIVTTTLAVIVLTIFILTKSHH